MQKKLTKGLFIDSSCKRSGLLKTLLQGFRSEQEQDDPAGGIFEYGNGSRSSPDERGLRGETGKTHIKRTASL